MVLKLCDDNFSHSLLLSASDFGPTPATTLWSADSFRLKLSLVSSSALVFTSLIYLIYLIYDFDFKIIKVLENVALVIYFEQ